MVALWRTVDRITEVVERTLLFAAIACVGAIMLISVLDALMRYLFGKPFVWSYTIISHYLLVALFFFAVSEAQKSGHHINVDFFTRKLSRNARAVCAAVASVCIMMFSVFVLIPAVSDLSETYLRNDVIPGIVRWPTWPTYFLVTLGTGTLMCRALADLLEAVVELSDQRPEREAIR